MPPVIDFDGGAETQSRTGYAGNLGRTAKQKRARPTADRGQRSLLLPIAGGRRKKEEAATEPALAATSRKRPERCQTTLLRNGSRWVLLSTRRLWRRTKHYGVALGPTCTIHELWSSDRSFVF